MALILLASCGTQNQSDSSAQAVSRDVFAMDTYMSLKAYGDGADSALDEASERITELEGLLSATIPESDTATLNRQKNAVVSDDTAVLISSALDYGAKTDGCLDVTVYPVLKEWGFTTGDYKIPEPETLSVLLENVNYRNISIEGNTATLPPDVEIDMGALAKGYTGDEVMEIMQNNGVESAIISLGGNVQALGAKPDGSPWKVAVRNPFSPDTDMCVIEIEDKAVITSGNYERFFTAEDGQRYWHIIDSADGYPADNGLVSVTIIGDSGLMCDALSTALFVMGTEKAVEYQKTNGGFEMILVTDDGRIMHTSGLEFKNVSGMPCEVIE